MSETQKIEKVADLEPEAQELSPEEAEGVRGGVIAIIRTGSPQPPLRTSQLLPYIEQDN